MDPEGVEGRDTELITRPAEARESTGYEGLLLKNRYRIRKELGSGGFGSVYLAADEELLSKLVVVKILHGLSADEWSSRKFRQEKEALARIDHPGVVNILDAGLTPRGTPFLVMQFVDGVTLRKLIVPGGMEFRRAVDIFRQIGSALQAAHSKGVCHRDLKPDNIMVQTVAGEDRVWLIDFGVAGVSDSAYSSGVSARIAGTVRYMAPEQLDGKFSPETDIFAFGAIAYEMLTGTPAFESARQAMALGTEGLKVKPREIRPEIPPAVEAAIVKALYFEAKDRFHSAWEMGDQLARELREESVVVPTAAGEAMAATPQQLAPSVAVPQPAPELLPVPRPAPRPRSARPSARRRNLIRVISAVSRNHPMALIVFTRRRNLIRVISALSTIVVLAAITAIYQVVRPKAPPRTASVSFQLKTDPDGATVTVDDSNKVTTPAALALLPGPHTFKLTLPGYKPIERVWNIAAGFSPSGPEHLEALPAHLQVTTDVADAKLTLDGDLKSPSTPGGPLDLPELTLGTQHTLQLAAGGTNALVSFSAKVARVPDLQFKANGTAAPVFVLSAFGPKGRLYSSSKVKLSTDGGQSYRDAGADGVDLDSIPADGALMVQDEKGMVHTLIATAAPAPTVQVFLVGSDGAVNVGGFSIASPEADFVVLVDGRKVIYQRKGPPYLVSNVAAGVRRVQIQKDGFRTEPSSIAVDVKANQVASVKVTFVALPTLLAIQGSIPGTRVSIGPRQVGVTDPRGELRTEMPPGTYTVTLSKDGYRSKTIDVKISNGASAPIAPEQSRLDLITGTITLKKEPSRMRLTIRQTSGVPMENPANYDEAPDQLVLPVGHYMLMFEAPGYKPDIVGPVGLTEAQNLNVDVKLGR
jgi:serine/threonine protein kinase